jgi:hypothetical protein
VAGSRRYDVAADLATIFDFGLGGPSLAQNPQSKNQKPKSKIQSQGGSGIDISL